MPSIKNAVLGASLASMALAHSTHSKRGTVAADGKIITSCVTPGAVALTFDDGPFAYTQGIVDKLTAAGHRATFFQNGQNYDSILNYGAVLNSMIAGGHQVASHTWSHKDLAKLTAEGITEEMNKLEAAHQTLIGKAPTYMRPPFLSTNQLAIDTLKGLGYKIISVDIDTQDWAVGPTGQILLGLDWLKGNYSAGGSIVLNHDPFKPTAEEFVPAAIAWLNSNGLKSVTVGECLGDDPANWYRGSSLPPVSVPPSSSPAAPSSSPAAPVPSGNGTYTPPNPTGTGEDPSKPTESKTPLKPIVGGDTEPGHGPNAGRGSMPGQQGTGDVVYPHQPNGTVSGSGSTSGTANTTAILPTPSLYTNGAAAFASSAFVVAAAAFAFLL